MTLPPILCPKCGRYLTSLDACASPDCDWRALNSPLLAARMLLELRTPVCSRPLALPARDKRSQPLAVFGYGDGRDDKGGLVGAELLPPGATWRREVGAGVVGGAAAHGRTLLFGDAAGFVHRLDVDSGKLHSSDLHLDGGVEAPPLWLDEARAVFVTDLGAVAIVDPRGPTVVRQVRVSGLVPGAWPRIAASPAPAGVRLVVGTVENHGDDGRLLVIDPLDLDVTPLCHLGGSAYSTPVMVDAKTALLAISRHDYGAVVAVDVGSGSVQRRLLEIGRRIRAAPTMADGMVYVGAHDHRLYRLDLGRGQAHMLAEWEHSITTKPLLLPDHDLLVFGDNCGQVAALDLRHAADVPVWTYRPQPSDPACGASMALLGGLLRCDDTIVFATASGQIHCLPYWHEALDWAERQAERSGDGLRSAVFAYLGGGLERDRRVAVALEHGGLHGSAGQAYEAANELSEAARAYERAELWDEAARVFEAIPDRAEAGRCRAEAARARGCPLLDVELEPKGRLKVGHIVILQVRIRNVSQYKARDLAVKLEGWGFECCAEGHGGALWERRELKASAEPWLLEFRIRPLEPGQLTVTVWARCVYQGRLHDPVLARWPHALTVEDRDQPVQRIDKVVHTDKYVEGDEVGGDKVGKDKLSVDRGSPAKSG